jgi:hypothetical protein
MGRLALAKWFFDAFIKHCANGNVIIDKSVYFMAIKDLHWAMKLFLGIIIADAFLAQEIGEPSPASGIENADYGHGIMWLVEKRRPTAVYRYSGTLSHHSQGKDQRSSTIYAFSHFVYGHSNKTLVFADLQGMFLLFIRFWDSIHYTIQEPLLPLRVRMG